MEPKSSQSRKKQHTEYVGLFFFKFRTVEVKWKDVFIVFIFILTLILDIDMMMMTHNGTLAAAAATDTVTLPNSKSSHRTSSRRPRSQVTKKIFNKNNNVSGAHLFA